ncbi:MAG: hypothetical protein Q8908_06230 [Bacteroidota bacterium]|nr:hypothetical protein [Bacteroidota bacterium]
MTKIRILKKIYAKYELDESELEFGIPVQTESPVDVEDYNHVTTNNPKHQ